jgi:hypothetical protein
LIELRLVLSFRLRLISVHVRDGRLPISGPFVESWLRFGGTVALAVPQPGHLDLQRRLADLASGFGSRVRALGAWCGLRLDRISGKDAILLIVRRMRGHRLVVGGRWCLGLGFLRRTERLRGLLGRHDFRLGDIDRRGPRLALLGRCLGLGFH